MTKHPVAREILGFILSHKVIVIGSRLVRTFAKQVPEFDEAPRLPSAESLEASSRSTLRLPAPLRRRWDQDLPGAA